MKRKLTFQVQMWICIGILIFCFILATITKQGIFSNIAWIIYGLFFIVNPVWPKMWDYADHKKLRLGCRIAGVLAIIVGIMTRFVM